MIPGTVTAHGAVESSNDAAGRASELWMEEQMAESAGQGKDVELVAEGITHWASENEEAPEWFTIHEEDELKYKPHGVFRIADADEPSARAADADKLSTMSIPKPGSKICLPTSVKIGPVTVGLKLCHYGGCKLKAKACLGVCIGTGITEQCNGYFSLGGDIGVVDAGLKYYPRTTMLGTMMVVAGVKVTGSLCYYYIIGSDCKTVSIEYNWL